MKKILAAVLCLGVMSGCGGPLEDESTSAAGSAQQEVVGVAGPSQSDSAGRSAQLAQETRLIAESRMTIEEKKPIEGIRGLGVTEFQGRLVNAQERVLQPLAFQTEGHLSNPISFNCAINPIGEGCIPGGL